MSIALVTGAGGGIGRAAAITLAQRGMDVAVHYHANRVGAEDTIAAVRGLGRTAEAFAADLARADEARRLVAEVERRFGRIDVLVNNAGDLIERRSLGEITEDYYRRVFDVNVLSTIVCCQAAVPRMIARHQGVIVNMSSLAARNGGGPGAAVYAAAKAAVMAFTRGLARDLAPSGVRVNAVAPGLIGATDFHARFTPSEMFEGARKGIPLGRAGTPEEVADVIAFLASDDSAFLVGETIDINGGALMT